MTAIPRQALAEFPQYAAKRSVKAKEGKQIKEQIKVRKKEDRVARTPEKSTTSRRKKVVDERPAPKTGRRGARS